MFSICGHILLYQYFVYKADQYFNEQISQNRYNISDLVEIKVPLHTPNVQNWKRYESISGQIQFRNTCYNYVKLKLTTDTIYLQCIPNYEKTRLFNQNIISAKEIADIPVSKKNHVPFGKINQSANYSYPVSIFNFTSPLAAVGIKKNRSCLRVIQRYNSIPKMPPKSLNLTLC